MEVIHELKVKMTPERRKAIDEAFRLGEQPPMRQMSFGGDTVFDENRKQVYLEGEFSKDDLLRIALILD